MSEPALDYAADDRSDGWQQQQSADQEWLELNDAINAICGGMRARGWIEPANTLETSLLGFFGVHSPEEPHAHQQRFEFYQSGSLSF